MCDYYYIEQYKNGLFRENGELILFKNKSKALDFIEELRLREALVRPVRISVEDEEENDVLLGKPYTPDIVIRYEWSSRTNYKNNYVVVVNMTKKMFYSFKQPTYNNEKNLKVYNNNDSLIYYIDLKDKASFNDLVNSLRKTDFMEL